jgi:hypothetical protein
VTAEDTHGLAWTLTPTFTAVTGIRIRWRHPQRGLLPPSSFIAIADDCGLLDDIDEWVLFEACRQAKAWQHPLQRPALALGVHPQCDNLASSQGREQKFVGSRAGILASGAPGFICLNPV